MRRRISVTSRHVEFLFGPSCKDSPRFLTRFRDVLSGLQFNREERDDADLSDVERPVPDAES